jgi:NADH:ubiquinone oxidoreductase subunit D
MVWLGPAGVDYDVRVAQPTVHEDFDFNVVGKSGDTYDRFAFVMRFGKV